MSADGFEQREAERQERDWARWEKMERDERLADEDYDDLRDVLIDIATTRIIEGSVQI